MADIPFEALQLIIGWCGFSFRFLWVPSLEVVLISTTGTLEREAGQEEGRPTQLRGGGLSGQSLGGSHAG